jgi:putative transposase
VLGKKLLNAVIGLLLATLPLDAWKKKQRRAFVSGLLGAALRAASLNAVPSLFKKALSGRRLRELAAVLDFRKLRFAAHKVLQTGLTVVLSGMLLYLAIDYTTVPYYGKPLKRKSELIRKKAERGTANHHAYATIYVILAGHRFTLAVIPVRSRRDTALVTVVLALIREAKWCGIRIRCLFLDREFCIVSVQKALQARHLSYCMSVKQQGAVNGVKAQVKKNKKRATKMAFTWNNSRGETVTADLYIVRRNARAGTGRTKTQYYTYVLWGISMSPKQVREFYRKRFGIESTYRMYDAIRGRTSSRNPALRYLYVIVAFAVLNQWALTKYATCAKKQRGPRTIDENRLRLKKYIELLFRALELVLGTMRDITVYGTVPNWYRKMIAYRR